MQALFRSRVDVGSLFLHVRKTVSVVLLNNYLVSVYAIPGSEACMMLA